MENEKRGNKNFVIYFKVIVLSMALMWLPWLFITFSTFLRNIVIFQPYSVMFIYYPIIFVICGAVYRKNKISLILSLILNCSIFSIIISLTIGVEAIQYLIFYLFFVVIGHLTMNLICKSKEADKKE